MPVFLRQHPPSDVNTEPAKRDKYWTRPAEAQMNAHKTLSTLTGTALIGHKKGRPQSAFHFAIRRLLFFQAVIGLFVRVAFAGGAVVITHFQEAVADEVDVAVARFVEA